MIDTTLYGFGLGVGTKSKSGQWLEVYYPQPLLNPSQELAAKLLSHFRVESGNHAVELSPQDMNLLGSLLEGTELEKLCGRLHSSQQPLVATLLLRDSAPASVPEAYLKLHFLSHRLLLPHQTNLTGIFGALPNVAWTSEGAIALEELADRQLDARLKGQLLEVMSVDKFPKMANYVIPSGIRIADTDRVRLGAHLGEGTTIMHEGFVNFNAGTMGASMVEGRISAGVLVGNGSDLGGGCSTMGTLSGGGNIIISVGEECLIGANAGIGIPLGDRCTVESGLYITAGTKVLVKDDQGQPVEVVKARDLAGQSDLLLLRDSQTGQVECRTNKSAVVLNAELHANN